MSEKLTSKHNGAELLQVTRCEMYGKSRLERPVSAMNYPAIKSDWHTMWPQIQRDTRVSSSEVVSPAPRVYPSPGHGV